MGQVPLADRSFFVGFICEVKCVEMSDVGSPYLENNRGFGGIGRKCDISGYNTLGWHRRKRAVYGIRRFRRAVHGNKLKERTRSNSAVSGGVRGICFEVYRDRTVGASRDILYCNGDIGLGK
ncbi:MAG: hypothetical protein UW92_C0026G0005 [Candidatus Jorgensenbacteria bacterium GW2011_GWA2_45_13]|uniref:Uncharacterized protein n=1 Tax=Candidatus Jorgensenbacteria bacterium GW2011_GWA2_45_13 TaxID=1618662 RepID=A0A0G1L4Q8_9BACT|nr:MAG: hypothetical protein UW92_C0026G0005 [Candidatus Jorgensenbacteria bacterium GW2011_GWA2_45_13]